ncbi:hypothetical protein [Laspinema palackyanum]|uniref:hypothetical protein n=1 Tax=Laspinema palackyanum TaxID=3231601 RepID=UPI00345CF075|nr:hypothetical protein [Laspinema sp. D2c]
MSRVVEETGNGNNLRDDCPQLRLETGFLQQISFSYAEILSTNLVSCPCGAIYLWIQDGTQVLGPVKSRVPEWLGETQGPGGSIEPILLIQPFLSQSVNIFRQLDRSPPPLSSEIPNYGQRCTGAIA